MKYCYLLIVLSILSCKEPQARKPISVKSGISLKTSAERTKKRLTLENEAIKLYIKNDSTLTYLNSKQGFWFSYVRKDTIKTLTPAYGNKITYSYSVQNLKNNVIYTEEEIGLKTHFNRQENILEGLRHGLTLMKEGENVKFIFPSQLTFGYKGDLNKINPNTPLIYNITLHKIESITQKKRTIKI